MLVAVFSSRDPYLCTLYISWNCETGRTFQLLAKQCTVTVTSHLNGYFSNRWQRQIKFYCCKLLHASFSERFSVTVPFARNYSNCNSHASYVIRVRLNVPVFIVAWIFISNYVLLCILNTGNGIFFISKTVHLNISVLLHMTSCYLTEVYGIVRCTCCLHRNGKRNWGHYVSLKGGYASAKMHDVTSVKPTIFSHRHDNFKTNIYFKLIFVENEFWRLLKII